MTNRSEMFFVAFIFLTGSALFSPRPSPAQDLYVTGISANPASGQTGDPVALEATIGNIGPGMTFSVQFQWFLSEDNLITTDDMALGDIETSWISLYAGDETIITKDIVMPSFLDPVPPSYLGLIIDPLQVLFDNNPSNDADSTAFTFTGTPPVGFFDPAGDNYLDVTHISAQVTAGNLEVTITFSEPPSSTVTGIMAIDIDQDPTTNLAGSNLLGAEAIVSFIYQEFSQSLLLQTAAGYTNLSPLALNGNDLSYSIPLSLLENDSTMDTYWAIDHALGPTTDFDRAPDVGTYAVDTNQLVVRNPGDSTISIAMSDPITGPDEPDFPNVKDVQAQVVGDQLEIILTYNHQVENLGAFPENNGLFVWIDFDWDHSICTGFKSTEERPPAFGIDYELRLQIDPLAGTVCELLRDKDGDGEPETIPMGLPFNDIFLRLSGDTIICRVPLGYFNSSDVNGALVMSNLNTRDILTGIIDRVPDTGAWDMKTDTALPGQICQSLAVHLADPEDDSIGAFGLDNDELIGVATCYGYEAFLFAIDYESYQLSNDGATTIFLDTDRNTATGQLLNNINQDTQIGADWAFQTYWDINILKQITEVIRFDSPEVNMKNQLTTITLANRLYITIPLDCIGSPGGTAVNMFLETASWGSETILLENDNIPDQGVITTPTTGLAGDLNGDGDVDSHDLAFYAQHLVNGTMDIISIETFASNFGMTEKMR